MTEIGAGAAARPCPSQSCGTTRHDDAGTHPSCREPHEFQVIDQLPLESVVAATFWGAAGPAGPVVMRCGGDVVPWLLM